jgi:hypothetical protein
VCVVCGVVRYNGTTCWYSRDTAGSDGTRGGLEIFSRVSPRIAPLQLILWYVVNIRFFVGISTISLRHNAIAHAHSAQRKFSVESKTSHIQPKQLRFFE